MTTDKMPKDELLALLNVLLEAERAGARAVTTLSKQAGDSASADALREIAVDEGRFCVMLREHILRLKGQPSSKTGDFHDKLMALETFDAKLDLLDRGQSWVVRKIAGALPRLDDAALAADLRDMLDVHEVNIARAAALNSAS